MSSAGTSEPIALLQHAFEILSDNPNKPPPGYVFIPKGDVYVTRHCRSLTSASGRKLFIVYDRRTNGRLGIHCYQQIVEAVKEDAALTEEIRQKAVAAKDSRDHKQAHKMLLKFFPNIPKDAYTEILEHGFQKGSGRVGRSQTIEDELKVQLAVNAHIRHRRTQYDSILAASRGQDVKFAARDMVHDQVQAIADSWRDTMSQARSVKSRTSVPKDSAAILEANRQRRTQRKKKQTTPTDQAQVLEEALGGLHLNESHHEAGIRAKDAQRRAQKLAQKVARKAKEPHFTELTRDLLRQYERDPSIEMSKKQKKKVLRLQREQKQGHENGKEPQKVHGRQDPRPVKLTKREENRKLRVTANGVELEPRELDKYVPDIQPSDNRRTDDQPSDDEPRKPRLLRSHYRPRGVVPAKSGDPRDTPGDGVQRDDRYGPTSSDYTPHKSPYPLRSRHRTTSDSHFSNDKGSGSIKESKAEDRLLVEDSEWMDIDDISLRTAEVHLA